MVITEEVVEEKVAAAMEVVVALVEWRVDTPGISPGGREGGSGSCGSGNCNQPGFPRWIPTPGVGGPGGGCNCPTQPAPNFACPYGCAPPPGTGCFFGNTKQSDKENQNAGDHENGNREESLSSNFEKYD
ncbi:hypothetical protein K7X08_020593 [Anisodus acutangulus]|uniref:Uncharacterized protein n=1 Tax=Anisodus acutangulus TaxID=402998 RepID=A0A9Q1RR92_9SOLA|nr:hypothetical protein K7X08_020593 [Anisodus acutangulus]